MENRLRAEMKELAAQLRAEMKEQGADIRSEVGEKHDDQRSHTDQVRDDLRGEIKSVRDALTVHENKCELRWQRQASEFGEVRGVLAALLRTVEQAPSAPA